MLRSCCLDHRTTTAIWGLKNFRHISPDVAMLQASHQAGSLTAEWHTAHTPAAHVSQDLFVMYVDFSSALNTVDHLWGISQELPQGLCMHIWFESGESVYDLFQPSTNGSAVETLHCACDQ